MALSILQDITLGAPLPPALGLTPPPTGPDFALGLPVLAPRAQAMQMSATPMRATDIPSEPTGAVGEMALQDWIAPKVPEAQDVIQTPLLALDDPIATDWHDAFDLRPEGMGDPMSDLPDLPDLSDMAQMTPEAAPEPIEEALLRDERDAAFAPALTAAPLPHPLSPLAGDRVQTAPEAMAQAAAPAEPAPVATKRAEAPTPDAPTPAEGQLQAPNLDHGAALSLNDTLRPAPRARDAAQGQMAPQIVAAPKPIPPAPPAPPPAPPAKGARMDHGRPTPGPDRAAQMPAPRVSGSATRAPLPAEDPMARAPFLELTAPHDAAASPSQETAAMAHKTMPTAKSEGAAMQAPAPLPPSAGAISALTPPAPSQAPSEAPAQAPALLRLDGAAAVWAERLVGMIGAGGMGGDGRVIVSLAPEGLGRMELDLRMDQGAARLSIRTETIQAAQILRDGQAALSEALSRIGIELAHAATQSAPPQITRADAPLTGISFARPDATGGQAPMTGGQGFAGQGQGQPQDQGQPRHNAPSQGPSAPAAWGNGGGGDGASAPWRAAPARTQIDVLA